MTFTIPALTSVSLNKGNGSSYWAVNPSPPSSSTKTPQNRRTEYVQAVDDERIIDSLNDVKPYEELGKDLVLRAYLNYAVIEMASGIPVGTN